MDDEVTRYATQQPSTVDEFEYLCREVAGIWNDPDPLTEPLGGPVHAALTFATARHLAADGRCREVDTVREILLNFLDFEVRGLRKTLERNRLPDERGARRGMQHADLSLAREADAPEGRLAAIAAGRGA